MLERKKKKKYDTYLYLTLGCWHGCLKNFYRPKVQGYRLSILVEWQFEVWSMGD